MTLRKAMGRMQAEETCANSIGKVEAMKESHMSGISCTEEPGMSMEIQVGQAKLGRKL